jgi:hypothetical protein
MARFTLLKITRTRYMVGKKHVRPGTAGTVKVAEDSRHCYAYRRDGKRQLKVRLFTDKAASLTEMAKLNTALERGQAGMTDPRKEHLDRGALEHLEEFLPVMRASGKSEIRSCSHRSASQYQANMHSAPTTSPGRNGRIASRKAADEAGRSRSRGGAGRVADVDVRAPGVQVDPGVVWVRGLVVAWRHSGVSSGATGRPDPASWLPSFGIG